ncbi:CBS domain-containing protein [Nonomuraea gerenzanensis]|uniref:CBS domain containing protein n=1 Tax=Nonomuraea gerenzanensis TaxID=93944 RepID=A0A1M4EDS9_9ACTN|nr:CBS domain-containing protein [Nonomuraea gerenzanensis]UBU08762.1 CBS domain-containing protein [Nonomuraea gerenzanensis]SBO97127.1 CBS domain containing protein [Nonomuraea gerenzanensis]
MLVREVMSSPAIVVRRTDPVRRAIRTLYVNDITAAPVVDDSGRLVGVVSELDLLRGEFEPDPRATVRPVPAAHEPPPRRVMEVMTRQAVTVTETTDVTAAIDLMVGKRVKSLPVLHGDRITGMVSRRDLMAMLARPDDELRQAVVTALREQYPFGPSWEVTVRDGVAELSGPPHPHADHIADVLARTVPGIVRVKHLRRSP